MAERGEPLGNEYVVGLQDELESACAHPPSDLDRDDLVERISALSSIQESIREQLDETVIRAKELDVTWKVIGQARGVSSSAVQQMWSEFVRSAIRDRQQ